jgi:membrane-associated protease RseP (regulator of RpoE activity)
MGALVFAFFLYVLWQISNNVGILADGGFIHIAAETQKAGQQGYFGIYVAFLSFVIGLGNLLPLYPLDGGHIGIIHVRRILPTFEPYYRRLGMVSVVFLLVFQFVPDLYRIFV